MTRSILSFALVLATLVVPAAAWADDPAPSPAAPAPAPAAAAPTPAQLEKAKQAFLDGKKLHDAGKLPEAIEKFKESYNLSKNPVLLYNIAVTMEEAGSDDLALIYYRKFLTDAPADAAQRPEVNDRIAAIVKKLTGGTPDPNAAKPDPNAAKPDPNAHKGPVQIKPPGTYGPNDFQHQAIETAPPTKPLDVTAFVPEDSGFTVTLYFRTAGEGKFTSKVMKWRYKELVGRIPAPKMIGNAVQYYIEVKDQAGNVVTRAGKSTSPNLVNIEAGAQERFYPDLTDEGESHQTEADIRKHDEEDPFNKNKKPDEGEQKIEGPIVPVTPGDGFTDVGSNKFTVAKWSATGVAAAGLGLGITFFVLAGKQATALQNDAKECGTPPCRQFDKDYDLELQKAGQRDQTISNVALGFGIAGAAVAGYFWYKEMRAKQRGELRVSKATPPAPANPDQPTPAAPRPTATGLDSPSDSAWIIAPVIGNGFSGAAAAVRF